MPETSHTPYEQIPQEVQEPETTEPPKSSTTLIDLPKRLGSKLGALVVATELMAAEPVEAARPPRKKADVSYHMPKPETQKPAVLFPDAPKSYFDSHPEYLTEPTPHGEYPVKARKRHEKKLPGGETIFQDAWLNFYRVQKGDTIPSIRTKLAQYNAFDHLDEQKDKLHSFNIPAKSLHQGMWLPIPLENKDRILTDEQFAHYASQAVAELTTDPTYGPVVKKILAHVGQKEVVAAMMAIAKQESGGAPLGQFELHRWEPHHHTFSFSMFHILMEGPGLTARRHLNLSEGKLYHPKNAAKLFLGFMIEKAGPEKAAHFFPLRDHATDMARFYNGAYWKRTNPHYVEHLHQYLDRAHELLGE